VYRGFDWGQVGRKLPQSPELRSLLFGLSATADKLLLDPPSLYRRATSLADIPPSQLDPVYERAGANAEVFALAMADCSQGEYLRTQGAVLAVFGKLLRRQDCVDRCIQMLEAFREHVPLQRPGWTAYEPDVHLPPGGDGVWLGTSWGIHGIIEMLDILGDDVPAPLRTELRSLLRQEAIRIADDWAAKRPWYVKSRAAQSNQWIEVSAALARACLYLGDPDLLGQYNLAIDNLAETLKTLGSDGAFVEGVTYASMTEGSLFEAIGLVRATGDTRLDRFPFVSQASKWWLHMTLPGLQYVNCNDSRMTAIPQWAQRTPLPSMYAAAKHGGGRQALQQLKTLYPDGQATLLGIQYLTDTADLVPSPLTLPTFAYFPTQELVVWRSLWEMPSASPQAWSIWIRGGSRLDSHSHRDQGHVSIQDGGKVILLDCGTPDYSNPDLDRKYASAAGHNVLQIGELRPRNAVAIAPIAVQDLGVAGGRVSIDCAAAFPETKSYTRTITWSQGGLVRIHDAIVFNKPTKPGEELLRFHTGAGTPLSISSSGSTHQAGWSDAQITVTSKSPISVGQQVWPDAVREPFQHATIVIGCLSAGTEYDVTTEILIRSARQGTEQ
jgi:hypothetical protein